MDGREALKSLYDQFVEVQTKARAKSDQEMLDSLHGEPMARLQQIVDSVNKGDFIHHDVYIDPQVDGCFLVDALLTRKAEHVKELAERIGFHCTHMIGHERPQRAYVPGMQVKIGTYDLKFSYRGPAV